MQGQYSQARCCPHGQAASTCLSAGPHTAQLSQTFLHQNNVDVLPWPAYSPDFLPIEHLWDNLDRRVRKRLPQPMKHMQLVHALQEEWNRIPQAQIDRLIDNE